MSSDDKKLKAAKRIIDNAEYYVICECCESIVLYGSTFCPLCDGYKFNENIEDLKRLALKLAERKNTTILPPDQLL